MDSLDEIIADAVRTLEQKSARHAPDPEKAARCAQIMLDGGYKPYSPTTFRLLAAWMATERATRGVWLHGPAGTGKTMFARQWAGRLVPAADFVDAFRRCQGYTDAFWFRTLGVYDSQQRDRAALVIDDLGQEPTCVSYGQREEVLDRVLCVRYEAWQRYGVTTSITTNLPVRSNDPANPGIDERYGRRITDRLREMCTVVEFSGPSHR